jgi:hypothetical protein
MANNNDVNDLNIEVKGITPESLGFIGGFDYAKPDENQVDVLPDGTLDEHKTNEPEKTEEVKPSEKVVDKTNEPKLTLGELIRKQRADANAKQVDSSEATKYKGEVDRLSKELQAITSAPKFEDDPVSYLTSKKISPEEQITLAETILYTLAPAKAPPDLRFKLFEQKQRRDAVQRDEEAKTTRTKLEQETIQNNIKNFAENLELEAQKFTEGTYPESEGWFLDNEGRFDFDTYRQSLLATANNIAATATKKGVRADLTTANIAKTLETEIERRMKLRETKRAGKQTPANKPKTETMIATNKQGSGDTMSSRGLTGNTPVNRSMTDAERVRRAIAAGFGK